MEHSFDNILSQVVIYPMHALTDEEVGDQNRIVSVQPVQIFKFFATIILTLFTISFIFILVQTYFGIESKGFDKIHRLFNLNKESNIPTLFASLQLLIASIVLLYISRISVIKKGYWLFLSIVFLFLCIDETAQIHEIFNGLRSRVDIISQTGILNAWIFPYILLVLILVVFFFNFIFSLPIKTRNLFIISGVLFVGGAIGIELLQEVIKANNGGNESFTYKMFNCLEETCEMAGVAIYNYALLAFIASKNNNLSIKVEK